MKKGLVIGKFYPPHKGHGLLIKTALSDSDVVDVLVCDDPSWAISAAKRADWLKQLYPAANVHIIPDIGKDDDSKAWADHTIEFLGYAPTTVFSSELYGDQYAEHMQADHIMVDLKRRAIPVAASKIRSDVLKYWQYLEPVVRANFCVRVVLLGAESTGTTTLAKALAEHYKTVWVPEFGRLYSEAKMQENGKSVVWESQEFEFIARTQQRMEQQMAGQSSGMLICDTNATATSIWHKRYLGQLSTNVEAIAAQDKVDLYVITGDEIPFVQDGLRDGESIRHDMQKEFIKAVSEINTPHLIVAGSVKERLKQVVDKINNQHITKKYPANSQPLKQNMRQRKQYDTTI